MELRQNKLYFVGYGANHRLFKFWEQGTTNIYWSANAEFVEHDGLQKFEKESNNKQYNVIVKSPLYNDHKNDSNIDESVQEKTSITENDSIGEIEENNRTKCTEFSRRSRRERERERDVKKTVKNALYLELDKESSNLYEIV
uniref:Uncharacterized protein n=1 Tax=Micrurus spixii TaxID=129469 RepID=A0A2D4LJJ3_9SAUR